MDVTLFPFIFNSKIFSHPTGKSLEKVTPNGSLKRKRKNVRKSKFEPKKLKGQYIRQKVSQENYMILPIVHTRSAKSSNITATRAKFTT